MNLTKDEVLKLAREHGAFQTDRCNGGFDLFHFEEHELLAFANACEKIGMEKACQDILEGMIAIRKVIE